jgi:hypothetical protein
LCLVCELDQRKARYFRGKGDDAKILMSNKHFLPKNAYRKCVKRKSRIALRDGGVDVARLGGEELSMQDEPKPAQPRPRIETEREARQARVAAALRANLLRRKAQARARAELTGSTEADESEA